MALHPDEALGPELARELTDLLRKARKTTKRARRGASVEDVHHARTSLRRLETAVAIADALRLTPGKAARRALGSLHAIEHALGDTRDDDVLLASVGDALALVERVSRHRQKAARALRKTLTPRVVKQAFRRVKRLARVLETRRPDVRPPKAAPVLVRHRVDEAIAHAFADLLAYDVRLEVGDEPDDEVIHKVRSAARRLRYTLELFDGALPSGVTRLAAELHALQRRLGALHDHVVAIARLAKWIDAGKLPPALGDEVVRRTVERDRLRIGFAREWSALHRGFRMRLAEVTAGSLLPRNAAWGSC